jgi:hypothetical protein
MGMGRWEDDVVGNVLGLLARLEMMLPHLTARDIAELSESTDALYQLVTQVERLLAQHDQAYPDR